MLAGGGRKALEVGCKGRKRVLDGEGDDQLSKGVGNSGGKGENIMRVCSLVGVCKLEIGVGKGR